MTNPTAHPYSEPARSLSEATESGASIVGHLAMILPQAMAEDVESVRVLLSDIRRLTAPLTLIADDRGQCGTCGMDAEGPGNGVVACGKIGPCIWVPGNHPARAQAALGRSSTGR